jgi:hypothetical protein
MPKMFVTLCDDCVFLLKGALAGTLGVKTAAQIKLRSIVEETKNAYNV